MIIRTGESVQSVQSVVKTVRADPTDRFLTTDCTDSTDRAAGRMIGIG